MRIPGHRTINKFINRRGIILLYHRLVKAEFDPLSLCVAPDHFEEHLRIIKKIGDPVTMSELAKGLKGLSFGRRPQIAVTFDDGYADNFIHAKPLLEKYGVPATFFITTGAIDSREGFFCNGLTRAILAPERLPRDFEINTSFQKHTWPLAPSGPCPSGDYRDFVHGIPSNGTRLTRFGLYTVLNQMLCVSSAEEKGNILKQLADWSGQDLNPRNEDLAMTRSQLRSLSDCPLFEIGAHTVSHPRLGLLPVVDQEREIRQSRDDLENITGKTVRSFCYPFGHYNDATLKIVKRLRFTNACTVVPACVMRNMDPYLLPRFTVNDRNGEKFHANLGMFLRT